MVERPADVLPMDKTNPPRFDWFTRADMALRRVPGLGVVLTAFMLEYTYEHGRVALAVLFLAVAVLALLNEFLKPVTTGSSPTLSGGPSVPRRRPDPTSAV